MPNMKTVAGRLECVAWVMKNPLVRNREAVRFLYNAVQYEIMLMIESKAHWKKCYYTDKLNEDLQVFDMREEIKDL